MPSEWDQKEIEVVEYEEMVRITHHLWDRFDKFLDRLNSRIEIKDDWWEAFIRTKTGKKLSSDLDKGAERVLYHIYSTLYTLPLSVPIGADLMYETQRAIVHIDVKTINDSNWDDYKSKVNLERTQTSYSYEWFQADLPPVYSKEFIDYMGVHRKKLCLTYVIYILHRAGEERIYSVLLICVPNGLLSSVYGNIIQSGKSGKEKGSNARFNYGRFLKFKLLEEDKFRVFFLCKDTNYSQKDLIGIDEKEIEVPVFVRLTYNV